MWKMQFVGESVVVAMLRRLPLSDSWQDLKGHLHQAGGVYYADVQKDGMGVMAFLCKKIQNMHCVSWMTSSYDLMRWVSALRGSMYLHGHGGAYFPSPIRLSRALRADSELVISSILLQQHQGSFQALLKIPLWLSMSWSLLVHGVTVGIHNCRFLNL